ncbi:MAG: hypothetical protein WCG25_05275 [bacterium]
MCQLEQAHIKAVIQSLSLWFRFIFLLSINRLVMVECHLLQAHIKAVILSLSSSSIFIHSSDNSLTISICQLEQADIKAVFQSLSFSFMFSIFGNIS